MLLLLGGLATAACDRAGDAPLQANGTAANATVTAPSPDEVPPDAAPARSPATFDRSHRGEAMPAGRFAGLDGKSVALADFSGKSVLVNLWATWCAPCVKELPTLDRLAADGVRVVAVSQDTEGADKVRPFLAQRSLNRVQVLLDPKLELGTAFAGNLPVTILYDAKGREVWRRTGDVDWTSTEARAAVAEAA